MCAPKIWQYSAKITNSHTRVFHKFTLSQKFSISLLRLTTSVVVPYILVDILLSKSSTSKLGGFTQNEDSQSDVRVWCISPSPIGSVYAIYHPAWAFVLLIRVKGSQGLEFGISKCSACAFLWTYPEIRTCSIDD